MPVRQLSQPSVSASAMSSSETVMSTTWVSVTGGESASGAVGSSTTISISESDMRDFAIFRNPARIDCHHPRPVYAGGFAGLKCQSAEALAKAGKPMIQYYARLMLFRKLVEYWVPRWSLSPGGASRRPGGGA